MKVYTYSLEGDLPPDRNAGIARIWNERGWHPVIFNARTAEEAGKNAELWWASELAKEAAKPSTAALAEAARARKAAKAAKAAETSEAKGEDLII